MNLTLKEIVEAYPMWNNISQSRMIVRVKDNYNCFEIYLTKDQAERLVKDMRKLLK